MSVCLQPGDFESRYYNCLSAYVKEKHGGFCTLTTTVVISILFVRRLFMTTKVWTIG